MTVYSTDSTHLLQMFKCQYDWLCQGYLFLFEGSLASVIAVDITTMHVTVAPGDMTPPKCNNPVNYHCLTSGSMESLK